MKNYDIFYFCSKHILCVHVRSEAVLTSTHNLCFRAKLRNNAYPCKSKFYYIKLGCKLHGHVSMMSSAILT